MIKITEKHFEIGNQVLKGIEIDNKFFGFDEIKKINIKTIKRVNTIRDITLYSENNEILINFRLLDQEIFYSSLIAEAKRNKIIINEKKRIPEFLIFASLFSGIPIIVAICLIVNNITSPKSLSTKPKNKNSYSDSCIHFAKNAVKDKLKSPTTAEFSNVKAVKAEANYCLVTGNVDAQNSFGAMIRNSFTVEIEADGNPKVTIN